MKNPALAVLYVVAAVAISIGIAQGIVISVEYAKYDGAQHLENLRAVFGNDIGDLTAYELSLRAWEEFKLGRTSAWALIIAGAFFAVIPVAVTAIGRAQKNAMRELAATLMATRPPAE